MKTQLFKLSLSLFVIYSLTACNDEKPVEDNKANVEETKRLEDERKRIEEEKLAMDAEKKAMEETKEKDRLIAVEKLEKNSKMFQVYSLLQINHIFMTHPIFLPNEKLI